MEVCKVGNEYHRHLVSQSAECEVAGLYPGRTNNHSLKITEDESAANG